MSSHSPEPPNLRRPHPLAEALIAQLAGGTHAHILELGAGHGRNTRALLAAGFQVTAIADEALHARLACAADEFDGALSTHGLLHGTPGHVRDLLRDAQNALRRGAPAYFTFASTRDARFGQGSRIDERTYAAATGEEAGVPHVFFDEPALREMLQSFFEIASLEELDVDAIVGRWAHAAPPPGTVHWFARLRKPESQ